jgi:hypothetical protein
MYECVMGLKGFPGAGCILADDMVSVKQVASNISDSVIIIIIQSCTYTLSSLCCVLVFLQGLGKVSVLVLFFVDYMLR